VNKIKDTLYAKYIKARAGEEILENEQGFIVYKFFDKEIFLKDMFIDESARGTSLCRQMIEILSQMGRDHGCEILTATIHLNDERASNTMHSALHVGFKILRAEGGTILIGIDLKGVS
jgi:hypothetical protein